MKNNYLKITCMDSTFEVSQKVRVSEPNCGEYKRKTLRYEDVTSLSLTEDKFLISLKDVMFSYTIPSDKKSRKDFEDSFDVLVECIDSHLASTRCDFSLLVSAIKELITQEK